MKRKLRRFMAFLLAFCMCISLVNTSTFAAEVDSIEDAIAEDMQTETLSMEEMAQEQLEESTEDVETKEESTEVVEESTEVVEESTEVVEESTEVVEESTEAVEESTEAVEESTEAVEESTETVEESTEAAKASSEEDTIAEDSDSELSEEDQAKLDAFLKMSAEQEAAIGEVSDEIKNQVDDGEDTIAAAGISNFTLPDLFSLTAYKQLGVAPGITEEDITFIKKSDKAQTKGYVATVDLNNSTVGILAGYKDYDDSGKLGMQTVRDQAAACERKTGKKIVFAINGDYFNMSTGEPYGALIMNSKIVSQPVKENYAGAAYFAILKDGTAVIRDRWADTSDVKEAIGAPIWLVRDGVVESWLAGDTAVIPRAAVGIKADGSVVFFEADGRQAPRATGISVYETALIMKELGCVNAVYLDGGGSATFATRTEGENSLTVKNSPSDGIERNVSTTLLVYSDAKADGEFIHASLSPQGEIYTPGSEVSFTAKGADSAGAAADLPEDAKFKLKDESYGTIDSKTGVFRSNGTIGEVEVQLISGDTVVGETTISIKEPDLIKFSNEQVSLGFETESDLGLYVSCEDSEINYKDDDFTWTISNVRDASQNPSDKVLGTFNGNTFTSSDGATLYGTVTCTYNKKDGSKVEANVEVIVGLQPTVLMDFEDQVDENGNTVKAKDYWTFNRAAFNPGGGEILGVWDLSGNLISPATGRLLHGHYCNNNDLNNSRGGEESAEVVDIASGEPVLKGNYSLKLNYDFSNANGTEGACVGFSEATQEIPGNPTAIGMYVYVPENTANLWLRIRVKDGAGTVQTLNFTESTGINWTGWKYVEAKLELNGTPLQGPFSLIGGETIRVMYLLIGAGNFLQDGVTPLPKAQCKGSLYVDNVQFVYGANTDDTDNPIISSIQAESQELNSDVTLTSNKVSFEMAVSDVENKYTSGVDYSTVNVTLDGKNITNKEVEAGNLVSDESKGMVFLYNQYLSNGDHIIKFTIRDKFGNETSETRTFTVDGTEQVTPSINVVPGTEKAFVGEYVDLNITADQLENVKDVSTTIRLATGFSDYKVSYGENYEEGKAPVYSSGNNSVAIYAKKKADAAATGDGIIATLSVKIPEDISDTAKFNYTVTSGNAVVIAKDGSETEVGFATKQKNIDIAAKYIVDVELFLAGTDASIKVTDAQGNIAADVDVYKADGTKIGTTDTNGIIATSIFETVEQISLYAKDGQGYRSFITTVQSYTAGAKEDGTPTFVSLNASNNSETEKNITWISNPTAADKKAIAQVAARADYDTKKEAAFKNYEGEAKSLDFSGSSILAENRLVYANTVIVNGLAEDTEYVYRVGDGTCWSEVMNFKTGYAGAETNFFIIGDTQANDKTIISNIVNTLSKDEYTFGVQTGDFVEKADLYSDWDSILTAFDNVTFKSIDTIHVTGNHELYGDVEGKVSKNLFNLQSQQYYSVTYNNVYVAVIGYSSDKKVVKEAADWLAKDAAKSNARWKIVVSHQSPYGTNATTDDCKAFTEYIPEAAQKGGIDFMFSGHDHAYARTYPLTDGKKVVEEDSNTYSGDGIIYYVCGSTGEKSYGVTKNEDIHAEAGNDFYDGLYFTINATNSQFAISVHDETGKVVREFTKVKEACQNDLHTYIYKDDSHLVCKECGHTRKIGDYTGLVHDKENGLPMYLEDGKLAKNKWLTLVDDYYYFGSDGVAVTGTKKIDGIEYTFDENGKFVKGSFVQEEVTNGTTTKTITRYYTGGGVFAVHWQEIDGAMYYFKKTSNNDATYDLGMMYTGNGVKETLVKTVANNANRYYVFGEDGKLVRGAFDPVEINGETKIRYYWGETYMTGTQVIEGHTYEFDNDGFMTIKNLTDCNFSDVSDVEYTRKTQKPEVIVKDGDEVLTAGTYYNISYTNSKEVGTATITITGKMERGYVGTKEITFKINPRSIESDFTYSKIAGVTYSGTAFEPSVTAKDNSNSHKLVLGTEYTVEYKNNKNVGTATVKITGIGNYTGSKTLNFNIYQKSLTASNITISKLNNKTYTGKAITQSIQVKCNDAVLKEGTDYKVTYSNNKDVGVATVKIVGIGNCKATKTLKFNILQKNINAPNIKISDISTRVYTGKARKPSIKITHDGKTLKLGTDYKVTYKNNTSMGRASVVIEGLGNYKSKKTKTFAIVPQQVVNLKVTASTYNSIRLSWSKLSNVKGYRVYRSTNGKSFSCIATLTGDNVLTYTDKQLTTGKNYYYKVRAYFDDTKVNKRYYGDMSDIVQIKPALAKATIRSGVNSSAKKVTITWNKVNGASGYVLYQASAQNGTYEKVKTITSGNILTHTRGSLIKGKTYYYKVRAYITVDGNKVYGAYSNAKSVRVAR